MTDEEFARSAHAVGTPGFFASIVETAVDPIVVVDRSFILRYASPSIENLIGWKAEYWLERNIAELLDPSSLEVAIQGLDEVDNEPSDPNWVGAPVRLFLRSASGGHVAVDVTARTVDRTGIEGYVVQLHRAAGAQALYDAVDTILEGEDPDRAMGQLTALIEHDIAGTRAVLGTDWNGRAFARALGSSVLLPLGDPSEDDRRAIATALQDSQPVVDLFDHLSPETRARAQAQGMLACWCVPVIEETFSAALFIWNDDAGLPGSTYRTDITRAANLIRLALRWTSQQRQLAWDVTHDQLTGLTNRGEFQNALDASRGQPRAVLFCDLDDFKPVNEQYGHRTGDRVLAAVATRMIGVCGSCVVARVGGDEFAILVRQRNDLDTALRVAHQVQEVLDTPIDAYGHQARLGATIGVAIDRTGAAHSDLLLDEADRLLREGKAAGKCQVLSVTLGD